MQKKEAIWPPLLDGFESGRLSGARLELYASLGNRVASLLPCLVSSADLELLDPAQSEKASSLVCVVIRAPTVPPATGVNGGGPNMFPGTDDL